MQYPPKPALRKRRNDPASNAESGIVLLMVVFLTFLLLLSLAIAAPNWAKSLQRRKDIETIQRGRQYERAIQLYYRKFHRYPNTIKQLENTNGQRFLRRKYKDPLTGKDDWKLVLYGHAHVHPLGLFGKPLSNLGALQASGGMYAVSGNSGSGPSGSSVAGSGNHTTGLLGSSPASNPGSSPVSSLGSPFGASTASAGSSLGSSQTGSSRIGGLNGNSALGSPASASGGFQSSAPFVGVVPPINKPSIVNYRAQDNYSHWEFNYDPVVDRLRAKVSILGGTQSDLNGASSLNGSGHSKTSNTNSDSPFSSIGGTGSSNPKSNSNPGAGSSSGSGSAGSGTPQ